jgi:hypothetical protein
LKQYIWLLAVAVPFLATAQVRLVLTAALTNNHYAFRKQQYLTAFALLKGFGYHNWYVVEAIKKQGPTFLNDFSPNVFYATVNNPSLRNQGINEARTLLEGTHHFNFNPDDMIIKLTGRYHLMSDYFLKLVEQNANNYDAIVKVNAQGQVYTLGFAMKCKYLREMFSTMNYTAMEQQMINVEREVGNYIQRKIAQGNFKVLYVPKLNIQANLFGSAAAPGASGVLYY